MPRAPKGADGGLPSKREILDFINAADGEVSRREIARAFGIKGAERAELRALLKDMSDAGEIARWGGRKMASSEALPDVVVLDIVDQDTDGELLGAPAKWRSESAPPRIYIAPGSGAGGASGPALGVGDRVLARLKRLDGAYEARIIKRLGQSAHRILGLFQRAPSGGRVEPVDRKTKSDIRIEAADIGEAAPGDLVVVELKTDRAYGQKRGRIVEVAGSIKDQKSISLIALHAHRIPTGFPDAALEEAASAPEAPDLAGRRDLRDTPLVTIDPADARDHDDAVWAAPDDAPDNKGGWRVIVAIADVAFYVRPGGALDKAARERGNSTYLPDRVVPMLPERLSTDLCSLKEQEDRPCLAVEMRFDEGGRKIDHAFFRAIMRSHGNIAYEAAQAAHDGQPDDKTAPLMDNVIRPLFGAYAALAEARDKRHPLDLDLPERKIVFDENGKVAGVRLRERFDAHRLIEEFMIQANVCAAETLEKQRSPVLYRIHDEPDPEKLEALRDYLDSIGYKLAKGQVTKPAQFNQILEHARAKDEIDVVSEVVLRSQRQAVYAIENLGHFGLNLRRYAHFTSPIRRYADLVVHRALVRALNLGPGALSEEEAGKLKDTAEDISNFERRSMAAERESVDRLLAAHLENRVGAEFDGRVSGVTRFGLFIKLDETGADGLAPASSLGREYFHHDEARHALVGEETGSVYRLGQKVRVRLEEAAPVTGGLRFNVLTPPDKAAKGEFHKSRPSRRHPRGGPRRSRKRR